jgi:ketosteroid isomerase-like protein
MSEESTTPDLEELARRAVDTFTRRDIKTGMAYYAEGAVWDLSPQGLGVFEGRDAIRGLFEDWWAAFEDFEQEVEEFKDLGGGAAFVVVLQSGRLRGSSGVVALRYAAVGIWCDGLLQRITTYIDIDEARAAAERLAEERG